MGCIELQYGTQKHQNNPVVVHILQIDQEVETEEIGIIRQHHQACQQKQHIADEHDAAKAAHSDIGSVITLLHLHVVLAIDRAGLVGDDGPTHHGVFDVGFLRQMPGMRILNPASLSEQREMLRWAVEDYDGPIAVRYPRGTEGSYTDSDWQGLEGPLVKCHRAGGDVALITYGSTLQNTLDAAEELAKQGIEATVLRLLTVCPLPSEQAAAYLQQIKHAVVIEETASGSGIREALAWDLTRLCPDCRVDGIDLGRDFVPHGSLKELYARCGMDAASIAAYTREVLAR